MKKVDRVRVPQRERVQAPQVQFPLRLVVVPTGPLLVRAEVRDGGGIDLEDSSRVPVLVVLVALDFLNLRGGTFPSVGFVIATIRVSVNKA